MAQYATAADFDKYGLPVAALDGFTGDIDDLLIQATGTVNSYLRGRYKVPFVTPPDEIIRAVCIVAAYDLLNVRGFDASAAADNAVVERYKDLTGRPFAPGWLDRISQGRISLDVASDLTPSTGEGAPIVASGGATACARHCSTGHSNEDCWRFWG